MLYFFESAKMPGIVFFCCQQQGLQSYSSTMDASVIHHRSLQAAGHASFFHPRT
jgi:hypothetical protein